MAKLNNTDLLLLGAVGVGAFFLIPANQSNDIQDMGGSGSGATDVQSGGVPTTKADVPTIITKIISSTPQTSESTIQKISDNFGVDYLVKTSSDNIKSFESAEAIGQLAKTPTTVIYSGGGGTSYKKSMSLNVEGSKIEAKAISNPQIRQIVQAQRSTPAKVEQKGLMSVKPSVTTLKQKTGFNF